jgi:hypothetical protein
LQGGASKNRKNVLCTALERRGAGIALSLGGGRMRYIVALLLGVPTSVVVVWFLMSNAC